MLLDTVTCVGNESSVLECRSSGQIGDTQCAHSRAAGVSCQRETSKAKSWGLSYNRRIKEVLALHREEFLVAQAL